MEVLAFSCYWTIVSVRRRSTSIIEPLKMLAPAHVGEEDMISHSQARVKGRGYSSHHRIARASTCTTNQDAMVLETVGRWQCVVCVSCNITSWGHSLYLATKDEWRVPQLPCCHDEYISLFVSLGLGTLCLSITQPLLSWSGDPE